MSEILLFRCKFCNDYYIDIEGTIIAFRGEVTSCCDWEGIICEVCKDEIIKEKK
jgi:hypothetical protein